MIIGILLLISIALFAMFVKILNIADDTLEIKEILKQKEKQNARVS